jgi:hypothetical protein
MFGPSGTAQLDALDLPLGYSTRLECESLRDLIAIYDREVTGLDGVSPPSWPTIKATGPSRPSTGSGRCWGRCS